jgi:predicted nicotinamide N-methyase
MSMPGYRIKYSTLSIGVEDFHLCSLRDKQQFADPGGLAEEAGISSATWSLFGQLWLSGEVLARSMSQFPVNGLRILELGCGLGLASMVLQRLGADITASDYHPLAGDFLARNALLNQLSPIEFHRCDWAEHYPAIGLFNLIIGSDLLYERDHPQLLAGFIARHSALDAEVLIVDPRRGNTASFSRAMLEFGYRQAADQPQGRDSADVPFGGRILRYSRTG